MKRWQIAILAKATCASSLALGNPVAPTTVSGTAALPPHPAQVQVVQGSGAVINWQKFDIGAGRSTRFVQPSAGTAVLNPVLGSQPLISGRLVQSGSIQLVSPGGIVTTTASQTWPAAAALVPSAVSVPPGAVFGAAAALTQGAVTIRVPLVDTTAISIR